MSTRKLHYRRDSRTSTIDYSDITEISNTSLWDRSISASNEDRAMYRYKRKLERRWDDANPVKERGSMSEHWEMVNRIINRPVNGDYEALIYLKMLVEGEDRYEATNARDVCAPGWTLLHKLAFYGCPKCVSYLVKQGADLFSLDDSGNRPLDLARFGQSPAHRDIAIQLMAAMRKWRANDVLRKVREAKELEEALLMEETGKIRGDAAGGGSGDGGGGGGGEAQHSYGDEGSAVTWGENQSHSQPSSKHQEKRAQQPQQHGQLRLKEDKEVAKQEELAAAAAAQSSSKRSLLRRGLSWISGSRTGSSSGGSGKNNKLAPLPYVGGGSSGGGGSGGGSLSGYSAVSAAGMDSNVGYGGGGGGGGGGDGNDSLTTASSPYSRVETVGGGSTLSTAVREGRRQKGPKVGAHSRFVDPAEKVKNEERKERELEVIKEIYRTDFRRGTFNQDLLPHIKETVDGLRAFIPTLDPRLAKHIEQDDVDEDDEYAAEAAVLHGQLNMTDFMDGLQGPGGGEGSKKYLNKKRESGLSARRPTYGGRRRSTFVEGNDGAASSVKSSSSSSTLGGASPGGHFSSSSSTASPSSSSSSVASGGGSVESGGRGPGAINSLPAAKHVQRNRAKQVALARGKPPPTDTSISSQRRTKAAVGASRTVASELRYREGAALLGQPGWVSGSQAMSATLLYKEGRANAGKAEQSMADVPRLGSGAPLGSGSHAFRVGGKNEHAADKRLTALEALQQQRQKKWWLQKPGASGV